jgi:hypothetical protein
MNVMPRGPSLSRLDDVERVGDTVQQVAGDHSHLGDQIDEVVVFRVDEPDDVA